MPRWEQGQRSTPHFPKGNIRLTEPSSPSPLPPSFLLLFPYIFLATHSDTLKMYEDHSRKYVACGLFVRAVFWTTGNIGSSSLWMRGCGMVSCSSDKLGIWLNNGEVAVYLKCGFSINEVPGSGSVYVHWLSWRVPMVPYVVHDNYK